MPRLLLLAILAFFPSLNFLSATTQDIRHISNISVISNLSQDIIQLSFDRSFEAPPSLDFENGTIRMILPNTGFSPGAKYKNVNNRFIRAIHLDKEGKNTILEVLFANPDFQATGLINYASEGNTFNIYIDKLKKSGKDDEEGNILDVDNEKDFQQNMFSGDYFKGENITVNIIKMLLALFVLLLILYSFLWVYNRFFVSKFSFNKGKHNIRVTSSYHISPKQKIIIVEVNNMAFACGISTNGISLISKVVDNSFTDYLSKLDFTANTDIDFSSLRVQYLESKRVKQIAKEQKATSKRSFSAELINKVKNLKPID